MTWTKRGGRSVLFDPRDHRTYSINDSKTGCWAETLIPIKTETTRRFKYVITKGAQSHGHAGLQMRDNLGNVIPIYFQKGKPQPVFRAPRSKPKPRPVPLVKPIVAAEPELKCNKFTFDATESYDIDRQELSFLWDFGDGQTATEPVVTHIYEKGGEYKVKLTVRDDSGLTCDTASTYQTIKVNTAPEARFSHPRLVCVGEEVSFDAGKTTDDTSKDLSYFWKFGDGSRAEGQRVAKTYEKGGLYEVTLLVDDNEDSSCSTDTLQKTIRVNTPPIANAGKDVVRCLESFDDEYRITFDGSRSKDADNDELTYRWDFGDGQSAIGKQVTHVYRRSGQYTARLTVNDESGSFCDTDEDSLMVSLNKPPVAVAGEDKKICLGEETIFDGSASKTEEGETLAYSWDFGDGEQSGGMQVLHTYDKGGKYHAMLTVDDGMDTECSRATDVIIVAVNSQPQAYLEGPDKTCVDKTISFDASDSEDPDGDSLKYYWDFGDGTTSEAGARVSHAYQQGGTYRVSVTIDDKKESRCSTDLDSIKVRVNTPPVADAGPNLVCCIDEEAGFDGSGSYDLDRDILTYRWDFGDGTIAQGAKTSHTYAEVGKYTVVLEVEDNSGTECSLDTDSFVATVNAAPVPIIKIR